MPPIHRQSEYSETSFYDGKPNESSPDPPDTNEIGNVEDLKEPFWTISRIGNLIFVFIIFICIFIMYYAMSPCSFVIEIGKYHCTNKIFEAEKLCYMQFTETNHAYCDDCGTANLSDTLNEAKSWPFVVLIRFSYTWEQENVYESSSGTNVTKTFNKMSACTGTIIDRFSVITSNSCVITNFNYSYENRVYNVDVKINEHNPTIESAYRIFGGIVDSYDRNELLSLNDIEDYFDTEIYPNRVDIGKDEYFPFSAIFTTNYAIPISSRLTMSCLHRIDVASKFHIVNETAYYVAWSPVRIDDSDLKLQFFAYIGYLKKKNLFESKDMVIQGGEGDAIFQSDRLKLNKLSLLGMHSMNLIQGGFK